MNLQSATCVGVFAGIVGAGAAQAAQDASAPLDLSPTAAIGWITLDQGLGFFVPASGPGPVKQHPSYPRVNNGEAAATGKQPTFYMGDPNSPILQPWAKAELEKRKANVLAGHPAPIGQGACWPMGTPAFLLHPVQPVYFIQTPKEVLMTWQGDHMTRRVFLNVPHSKNVKPSWFGESVGHYEGDTLVVDTIGMNTQTYVDYYGTPHTDKLHVTERYRVIDHYRVIDGRKVLEDAIERFRISDGSQMLEVNIHVEDPGAFTTPWNAIQRYIRVEQGPMLEVSCAEHSFNYFNNEVEPIPMADKPDF